MMNDFKVGDVCYFLCHGSKELVFATENIWIDKGKLEKLPTNPEVYKKLFKSKQECIDAFKKRLDEL